MYVIPSSEKGIDEDKAPLKSIRGMNKMIRILVNKYLLVKFGPLISPVKRTNLLLAKFPEDVNIVERYVFDHNKFIFSRNRSYITKTSIGEIKVIIARLKNAHNSSNVSTPTPQLLYIGTIIGFIIEMATSRNVLNTFKKKFQLSYLRLW